MMRWVTILPVAIYLVSCGQQQAPAPVTTIEPSPSKKQIVVNQINPGNDTHRIVAGDTLSNIAARYNTTVETLLSLNNLRNPDYIQRGMELKLPNTGSDLAAGRALNSPVIVEEDIAVNKVQQSQAAVATAADSNKVDEAATKIVTIEDPLAPKTKFSKEQPASSNKPVDIIQAPVKQTVAEPPKPVVPSKTQSREVAKDDAKQIEQADRVPSKGDVTQEGKEDIKPSSDNKNEKRIASNAPDKKRVPEVPLTLKDDAPLIWPVQGRLIDRFGPGAGGDGINIAVAEGTPVLAAAGGTVIYSGSGLGGYGNLILLRHKDGLITAYAYNKEVLVKKTDEVKDGEIIAYSGSTGAAREPSLHFEVRQGAAPVDPLNFLPKIP